jgi:hypothetical protein
MTITTLLIIFLALQIKHFVVDFPLQTKYQWSNKGAYGHPGGVLHAALHAVGTYLCVVFFTKPEIALGLALIDCIVHYHIDWAKMNINKWKGWAPTTHPQFWVLLGLDQLLHQLTYIAIVFVLVTHA